MQGSRWLLVTLLASVSVVSHVSGSVLRARYRFVQEKGAFDEVCAVLSDDVRERFEKGFLETEWYARTTFEEIMAAIVSVIGEGDVEVAREAGAFACQTNLTGVQRIFFKFGSPSFTLDRASRAWKANYSLGSMEVLERSKTDFHTIVRDYPEMSQAQRLTVLGWMEKALEIAGEIVVLAECWVEDTEDEGQLNHWKVDWGPAPPAANEG